MMHPRAREVFFWQCNVADGANAQELAAQTDERFEMRETLQESWCKLAVLRLKNTQGFMLAEQLISIVFIGLLCIAIAAGLGAAMSAYANITTQTSADTLLSQAVEVVSDQLAFAQGDCAAAGGSASFVSASTHTAVSLSAQDGAIVLSDTTGTTTLVPVTDSLSLQTSFSYDDVARMWTCSVSVYSNTQTEPLAKAENLQVTRMGS